MNILQKKNESIENCSSHTKLEFHQKKNFHDINLHSSLIFFLLHNKSIEQI